MLSKEYSSCEMTVLYCCTKTTTIIVLNDVMLKDVTVNDVMLKNIMLRNGKRSIGAHFTKQSKFTTKLSVIRF